MEAIYLDYNSTNPISDEVINEMVRYLKEDFGNPGSRTHSYGQRAKVAVNQARRQLAKAANCRVEEITFTSGATESNNLAILGLKQYGTYNQKKHIISTSIEHKSVLAPLYKMTEENFEIDYVSPGKNGQITANEVLEKIRPDTLLVSVMGVNNETGAVQPIQEIAAGMERSEAYLHVDASQGFLKAEETYSSPRIDLMTLSSHKVGGPKGVGALIARRRAYTRPPLEPIMYGGDQERGLRPGTLPVPLIVGFAKAVELIQIDLREKLETCRNLQKRLVDELKTIEACFNCDPNLSVPTTINFSIPGVDSEAAIMALKSIAAVSNGSACTSQTYEHSHVLTAANLPEEQISGAIRISWGTETQSLPIRELVDALTFIKN